MNTGWWHLELHAELLPELLDQPHQLVFVDVPALVRVCERKQLTRLPALCSAVVQHTSSPDDQLCIVVSSRRGLGLLRLSLLEVLIRLGQELR